MVLIRPSSMVFAGRDDVVLWISLSMLVLLAATVVLVWRLLDKMVARRVDATNETLQRITDGDLEASVQPQGAHEFWDLAEAMENVNAKLCDANDAGMFATAWVGLLVLVFCRPAGDRGHAKARDEGRVLAVSQRAA